MEKTYASYRCTAKVTHSSLDCPLPTAVLLGPERTYGSAEQRLKRAPDSGGLRPCFSNQLPANAYAAGV
jgi:hypothetical protein